MDRYGFARAGGGPNRLRRNGALTTQNTREELRGALRLSDGPWNDS
jgi:hypothetical protein